MTEMTTERDRQECLSSERRGVCELARGSVGLPADDGDLLVGESVELVDQRVDLVVGGRDLALDQVAVALRLRLGQALVQLQHPVDQ